MLWMIAVVLMNLLMIHFQSKKIQCNVNTDSVAGCLNQRCGVVYQSPGEHEPIPGEHTYVPVWVVPSYMVDPNVNIVSNAAIILTTYNKQ